MEGKSRVKEKLFVVDNLSASLMGFRIIMETNIGACVGEFLD